MEGGGCGQNEATSGQNEAAFGQKDAKYDQKRECDLVTRTRRYIAKTRPHILLYEDKAERNRCIQLATKKDQPDLTTLNILSLSTAFNHVNVITSPALNKVNQPPNPACPPAHPSARLPARPSVRPHEAFATVFTF